MAVTLQQFINEKDFQMLELRAGENGLMRTVSGLNLLESSDLSRFCLVDELVICTGIQLTQNEDDLLQFIRKFSNQQCVGLVINIGPYIPSLPKEAIDLANELNFPLFQMEWQFRIVDLLRTSFQYFISKQSQEVNEQKMIENLLVKNDSPIDSHAFYTQTNFKDTDELGIIVCTVKNGPIEPLEATIHRYFSTRYRYSVTIRLRNQRIYLISRSHVITPDIPFARTIQQIIKNLPEKQLKLSIGMGNFYTNLEQISTSYEEADAVIKLSTLNNNPHLYKYKELGTYKILMAVNDKQLLQTFAQDMLGNLFTYDAMHHSDFVQFLRIFIEEDGQTIAISKRLFIHRNTVLYKVKKIETLLDVDLNSSFAKTNLSIAFMIQDMTNAL